MIEQFNFVNNLPGLFNVKGLDSRFIGTSKELAKLLGWSTSDAPIGKSDFDTPCGVSEFAREFINMDKKVIDSGKKMLAMDIQNYSSGWATILAEKNPIIDENNNVVGILSTLINVTDIAMFSFYFKLYQLDTKWFGKYMKPASYILSDFHCPLSLTDKQENCLFLLVRGKSIKQIAKILKVSPRTVDSHFDAIKIKLNAENKSEIIEKSIEKGFMFYIPKYFQDIKASNSTEKNTYYDPNT